MLEEVLMLLLRVEMPESYFPISEYRIGEGVFTIRGDLGLFGLLGLLGLMRRGVALGLWPISFVTNDGVEGLFPLDPGSKPVGVREVFLLRGVASFGLPDRGELM